MRHFVILFILLAASHLAAALPSYYPSEFSERLDNGLKDGELKEALFEVLSEGHLQSKTDNDTLVKSCSGKNNCIQHRDLGYTLARKIMFGQIHLEKTKRGYAVRDVYCQTLYEQTDFEKNPPGPDKIPDSKIMNTEHSWPQSHFSEDFPEDLQKSDLNILFPVNSRANSSRNNLDMAEVSKVTSSPCANAKRGYNKSGGKQVFFEPPDEQKGLSARAILYFSVRYKMPVPAIEEAALRKWHQAFPPTDFERSRNEQVYEAQQNRNPFIDEPDLVDRISDF